mmetsp:Transcript_6903/g.13835  ORF Transcript_6903/g.13835 Transcript_6903/m.13835 type:complete len:249 (+) Transcript_6903:2440-3186(+)
MRGSSPMWVGWLVLRNVIDHMFAMVPVPLRFETSTSPMVPKSSKACFMSAAEASTEIAIDFSPLNPKLKDPSKVARSSEEVLMVCTSWIEVAAPLTLSETVTHPSATVIDSMSPTASFGEVNLIRLTFLCPAVLSLQIIKLLASVELSKAESVVVKIEMEETEESASSFSCSVLPSPAQGLIRLSTQAGRTAGLGASVTLIGAVVSPLKLTVKVSIDEAALHIKSCSSSTLPKLLPNVLTLNWFLLDL